jgi:hypothetical protein
VTAEVHGHDDPALAELLKWNLERVFGEDMNQSKSL